MQDDAEPGNVVAIFEGIARNEPARSAVRFGLEAISYGELNARANRLARWLRARGIAAEVPVGLCCERGFDLPVGMLAVLKSGGVYVPLDPEQPDERLALIVRDTACKVVLAHRRHAHRFADAVVIEELDVADEDASDLDAPAAEDLAYVIYTSGSTGPPKGVMVEHGAIAARYPLSPYVRLMGAGDVLAAVTAVSWNPSVYEVLYTMASGATIALAALDEVRDPVRLGRFLEKHGVTFMRAVPSLWQALVASGWAGKPDLTIVCHGEALGAKLAAELLARGRGLWNTYGSTEATSFSLIEIANGRRVIPIGLGALRVLDEALRPTAIGEPGEVHLEAPLLARGYLNDAALTAARFVRNGDERLYKTGDIARVLADGAIELIGRRDEQVKIRGHRVELGEVEAAILRHAPVKEVAVAVRERAGDRSLVAYLVMEGAQAISSRDLRAALRTTLPEFMLPAAFVTLSALPRNANGKVDRAALPLPDRVGPVREGARVEPEGEVEGVIAELFAEVLGWEVGADEDFFELGGHSLSAAQVNARVHQRFGVDITLVVFFANATVQRLAREVARSGRAGTTIEAPVRVAERTNAALSYAQERLWFLHTLTPDEVAYNLPTALELLGPLDRGALMKAIAHVVERHEALRTSFTEVDGRPRQTVEAVTPTVVYADIGDRPADEARAAAKKALDRDAQEPFDLGRAPLLRAVLLKVGAEKHVLYVCMHHIASDGWSKAVLRRELAATYNAFVRAEPSPLPPLTFQTIDHAAWQRTLLARELGRQLAYWKARLDGLEVLALPTDRPRPKVFSYRGARLEARLPAALRDGLEALAHQHGASLYMVLLAAFQVLLARYSGQRDIAVGSPIAGRNLPETEGLIGFFVNTLVQRAHIEDAPFTELLAATRESALAAYAHQDLPFERLVAELNPERDMGRHPLVQVVLALQNTPWEESGFDGLEVRPFELGHTLTRLDLELHVWPRRGELACHLIYSTDLFDEARMRRLLVHFETLLGAIVHAPETPIDALELLAPAEREQLLTAWNATARPIPELPVHALVAARAAETPDALALAGADLTLSYRELDRYANRLAHHLRALGVDRGARVGICLERSAGSVVAQLAIAKAGGAWLPLDPEYPDARLRDMLSDAGAAVLVTDSRHAPRFPSCGVIVALDADAPAIAAAPADAPIAIAGLEDLAYVIYTSGSTGRPNGVEISHRGLANLVSWHVAEHEVRPADRATLFASPSFDASVLETWPYLVAGASLHVVPDAVRRSPASLVAFLSAQRISICFLPTPLIEPCFDAGLTTTSLRAVITGGDRLLCRPPAHAGFTLFNHYGPTEITVAATSARIPPDDAIAGPPPIGRPLANTQCYVLDGARRPQPIGVPGELYIGGAGVARGYSNRPELTAERFVPSPFAPGDDCGRLYRSGDLVRWRPDGQLEFLGRVDQQVKLRGFRIEPAEIDAAIASHPGVAEVVTVVRDDPPAERRLVSYVVADRRAPGESSLALDYVARWRELYELEYRSAGPDADPEFDITGWNSSFTGEPIPAVEMREWVDHTVAAIRTFAPKRVLEIGSGTGLLLFPLARHVERYVASDFSAKAVAHVRRRVAAVPALRERVTVTTKAAHDLAWLDDQRFDTIVLNSIVQYFPSLDYLADVLTRLVAHVVPGGRIFVGDVRDLDLLEAFHRAIELAESGDGASARAVKRIQRRMREDKELLLAPAFFRDLASHGRFIDVDVQRKRGRFPNEMNRFRYDVTLHIGPASDASPATRPDLALASDPLRLLRATSIQPGLRERLRARLPEHMMPAAFVFPDALPLTPNGKIDRRALPPPAGERSEQLGAYVPPRTPTEQALASIFQASLGVDAVSVDDNFFELGGHSLLAVQVVARIQDTLGIELPLAALFEAPTIAGLARAADTRRAPGPASPAEAQDTATRLPLTPMDANFHYGRIFFGAAKNAWHQALEIEIPPLDPPLLVERLEAAILYAVNRHPLARGRLSSSTALGKDVYWDVARRLDAAPLSVHETSDDARFDAEKERLLASPYALDEAPAFRFALVRGPGRDVLLVRYNHGAVDASGLQCMLDSVLSRYLGRPDPARRVMPFETDELIAAHDPSRVGRGTFARLSDNNEMPRLSDLRRPARLLPAPIYADGGSPGARGCDTIEASFSAAESRRLTETAKAARSTLDRLFMVGLLRGATAWNHTAGETRRVESYWAVNLRPPRFFGSVVANHFAWSRVRATLHPETDPVWVKAMLDPASDFLVRGALDWMQSVEGFHALTLPAAMRGALMKVIRHLAPSMIVTNTLPFGELDQGELARAFGVRSIAVHSRYAHTDRPVIVIRERAGRFELRMIYPRALFDARGAARFLAALKAGVLQPHAKL